MGLTSEEHANVENNVRPCYLLHLQPNQRGRTWLRKETHIYPVCSQGIDDTGQYCQSSHNADDRSRGWRVVEV